MELKIEEIKIPEGCNVILGQTHFIKTIEDLYEAFMNTIPNSKFGIAFSEASGPCLIRSVGNDEELKKIAEENALKLGCGHIFIIFMREGFPINILNTIKSVPEVCSIYCATANPLQVVIAETEQGRGILGVIDGFPPKGVEEEEDIEKRKEFLRKIGYKFG
ncbi:MAG: adenosine-specific kinase [Candidatus Hydrothermarchaeota archaeon]